MSGVTESSALSWTIVADNSVISLSEDTVNFVKVSLFTVLQGAVALMGVICNSLNMAVFIKIGLKDSMSVGLFALSFTDLAVVATTLARNICDALKYLYQESPVDLHSISYQAFGWTRTCTFLISCWITALLSVERCFCVVSPFRVRQLFTRTRCTVVIATIYVVHAGVYLPVYIGERFEKVNVTSSKPTTNLTVRHERVIIRLISTISKETEFIIDIISSFLLSLISQIIILVCTVWMIYALRISSSIRNPESHTSNSQGRKLRTKLQKLSYKERKLVSVVLILSVMSIVCCIPKFITVFANYVTPETLYVYEILTHWMWHTSTLVGTFSCSFSFIVYFRLGSNYKRAFINSFCPCFRSEKNKNM